jgi:hypothetical protein
VAVGVSTGVAGDGILTLLPAVHIGRKYSVTNSLFQRQMRNNVWNIAGKKNSKHSTECVPDDDGDDDDDDD